MKNKIVWLVIIIAIIIIGVCLWVNINFETTSFPSNKEFVELDDGYTQEQLEQLKNRIKLDLPKMDGSTSLIPLEAGIRATLYGISQEEAESQVNHSTTYGSFYNLINGIVDLIFSTPLSQEQIKTATQNGMELELIPISKEAFVFVVNANNPVNSLTQQQLKDIYSGKITNWKEVGGKDEPIVAYQRNATSGSQNYMIDFMGETQLMKPVTNFIPDSMIGLMDAIAVYDNSENSIEYSVYAYAADMYGNGNEIKFISVDGIQPTKDTMSSAQYPLLNYNYAIFDKAKEEDSTTRLLVEWMLTNEGQRAISNAGYIPVKQVKANEQVIQTYIKKGTGKEKPDNYVRADKYYTYIFNNVNNGMEIYNLGDDISSVYMTELKNEKLQTAINKFIQTAIKEIEQRARIEFANGYKIAFPGDDEYELYEINPQIVVQKKCINGYLSVFVYMPYTLMVQDCWDYVYYGKSAVYDLYEGKKIQLSDMFYKDIDFVRNINEKIKNDKVYRGPLTPDLETKREFAGIQKDFSNITLSSVFFEKNNSYFAQGEIIGHDLYFKDVYIVYEPRDMKDIFVDGSKITQEYFMHSSYLYNKVVDEKDRIEYNLAIVDTDNPTVDNKINEYIKDYVQENFDREYIEQNYTITNEEEYNYYYLEFNSSFEMYGTQSVIYSIYLGEILSFVGSDIFYNAQMEIDLKTGELINIKRDIRTLEEML